MLVMTDWVMAGAVVGGATLVAGSISCTFLQLFGDGRTITTGPIVWELGSRKTQLQKVIEENYRLKKQAKDRARQKQKKKTGARSSTRKQEPCHCPWGLAAACA